MKYIHRIIAIAASIKKQFGCIFLFLLQNGNKKDYFNAIFNNTSLLIFYKDENDVFVRVNPAAATLFGKTADDFSGHAVTDFFPDRSSAIYRDDVAIRSSGKPKRHIVEKLRTSTGKTLWASIDKIPIGRHGHAPGGIMIVAADISDIKQSEEASTRDSSQFKDLSYRIPAGVYTLRLHPDGQAKFEYVSEVLCRLLGTTPQEARNDAECIHGKIHPEDRASLDTANRLAASTLQPFLWEGRSQIRGATGWVHIESNPIRLPNGDSLWNGIVLDITNKKRMEKELRALATTDDLTGLSNRRHFMEVSEHLFKTSIRYSFKIIAVMLDIDHFKSINDSYGHAAGDAVLISVSALAKKIFRASAIIGRLGGEEFGIVIPQMEAKEAFLRIEQYREAVASMPVAYDTQDIRVTISCGICLPSPAYPEFSSMLKDADKALYAAKRRGRNRTAVFDGAPEAPPCANSD